MLSLIISIYWGPVGWGATGPWLKERGPASKVFHHLLLNHVDLQTIVLCESKKKGEGMLPFSAPVMPVSWFMWLSDADLENIWAEKANGSLLCVPQPSVCLMTAGFGYSLLWFRAHSPMWLKWTSWAKTQFSGDCRVSASGKTFLFIWHLTFSDSLSCLRESKLLIWVFEEQILN